jgi:2-polyprenyl-6-methoxyphenol hydroxylase-like FAD-dependent oxidoreductase
MVLAYLLARQGLRVALLEARGDFARRFRGDSLAPAVMDWLDELGLGDEVLARPHAVADGFTWHAPSGSYRWPTTRRPAAATRTTCWCRSRSSSPCSPTRRPRSPGSPWRCRPASAGWSRRTAGSSASATASAAERRASCARPLVVGADGRFSQTRRLGGFASEELGAGLDILWFEVPRHPDDPPLSGLDYFSAPGRAVVALGQGRVWQLGYIIPTGTAAQAREAGVEPVVALAREQLPWLGDRLAGLTDFSQLTLLNVRITRLPSWYRPGLLLLGDAAHVISPVGGNGINIAVADAADAGNTLAGPLASGDPARSTRPPARSRCAAAPSPTPSQRNQVRTERGTVERLRRGDPEPRLKVAARSAPGPPRGPALGAGDRDPAARPLLPPLARAREPPPRAVRRRIGRRHGSATARSAPPVPCRL